MSDVQLAVREAVTAIYLSDSSDYLPALYSVVQALDPEMAALMDSDMDAALALAAPDLVADSPQEASDA
ncbi:hypothetical protein ABB26_10145 [Stenotrophomonas humi]|uniref:Uncharacterized protein n=1 Tax=Stenotrophomonas humi TaxID=405444 RepID=A0A0R0CCL7_9GAMM|nr:hypothetical protein [Stenotrophomonas humi]KRG63927.1 hypothetical protein ABB26_10145 [Stenotrophomonas humi]